MKIYGIVKRKIYINIIYLYKLEITDTLGRQEKTPIPGFFRREKLVLDQSVFNGNWLKARFPEIAEKIAETEPPDNKRRFIQRTQNHAVKILFSFHG